MTTISHSAVNVRKQKRWIVDTPVLGICPVCERDAIVDSLDIKATLDASPNEPFKCFSEADEAHDGPMEGNRDADETVDFGVAVELEEEQDVAGLLRVGPEPATVVNPKLRAKQSRQWIGFLALNFTRGNQRRPDDPSQIYRLDESEADRFTELKSEGEETDTSDDDTNVIVKCKYDGSVTLDVALGAFEPVITPLMQGDEGRGIDRLGDLSNIKHVVVVGPFCSRTSAMCEYLEMYFGVVVHPPRLPPNATGWFGDMSEPNYQPWRNHWQVGWKHMPALNSESSKRILPSDSLLIQMIREPLSWTKSLASSPYSLESNEGMQKIGDVGTG